MERLYLYQSKTNAFIKKLWLLATFLVFALQANAQCPPGDVELHSVYDLEQFWIQYPNCTQITGTLQLGHLSADYDLTNFSIENFLSQLQSVGGLKIYRTNLTNLNGLSNLTNINGVLDIRNNNYLLNISGLQNVNANGITNLNIQSNFSLYNCHIATVCSYLQGSGGVNISNNAGCHSVAEVAQACLPPCVAPTSVTSSGIAPNKATINWTSSGSTFDLEWGMVGFTQGTGTTQNGVSAPHYQITGLSAITSYDVYVRQNCAGNQSGWVKHTFSTTSCEAPTSITFSNITQANATINWTNSGIFDLEWGTAGFTQGTGTVQNGISSTNYQIGGLSTGTSYDVYIRQNCTTSQSTWVKRTFSTLGVCPTGNVELYSQADLDHFVATYPNCTQISGSLWIQGSGITSLMPLNSIQSVGGDLTIRDIQSNLSGFSSLTSVNGDLVIWENPQLTNLNGLTSLTSINGKLEIFHNLQLTNISGIQNVNTGISELRILYNSNLSTCNVASVCTYLEGSGDRNIAGNATGCEDVSAIAFSCIPACVEAAGVTFSTIVSDQATINWTNSGTFDLEWGTTGFAQGTGTAQNAVSALYYQITGLSPSTSYDVYVRQNCTINQSDWVKYTFSTISCAVPAGITSSNIVSDKATLNWTNPGTFDLEWGTTGFAQGTGTAQNGVSASYYQITGLSASTSYDVYVRQNCTSNQSDWVKHTFSTISTCPPGNVLLRTQQEVNAFGAMYPNCTEISGAMTINNTSNISDLSPLGTIISIGGFLVINNTYSGLHGLSSLTSVGGYLTISSNHNLYNLNQLSSLVSIGGDLQIQNNGNLNNISGLQHVSGITNLVITNNQSLSVCTIESVCNYLNGVGYYYGQISGNAEGCENKDVVKSACPAGPQPECLPGNVYLNTQAALYAFAAKQCTEVVGNLSIADNVTDLSPLSTIVSITGDLAIYSTAQLTSLNGLSSLTSIGGSLMITYNSQLPNLNGLSSLTNVAGDLNLQGNSQLTDISELSDITGINNLYILSNPMLSSCNIASICNHLQSGGTSNVSSNGANCVDVATVIANCPLPCQVPANITSSTIVSDKATINWANSGIFDLEWGTAGFKENSLPSLGAQSGVSALQYQITGLSASTSYDVYVRQNCTNDQSEWVKYTFNTVSVCPSGNVNLLSQADVAHFAATYPNCTEIEGNLFISGYPNGITDISPLQHITSIGGELEINSSKLVDLDGLSNLTSVGGRIALVSNLNLVDISGLSTIDPSSITGYGLSIHGNLSLTACNIESFCSYLSGSGPRNIYGNKADCSTDQAILVTCDPLVAQDCEGDVLLNSQMAVDAFMANNPGCTHISGNLTISGDGITNLSSLNAVTSIGGNLTIKNTTILYNLTGLGSVNSIGGELFLEANARLQDITALTSLNSVGGLSIYQNPLLSSINVFGDITSVNGSIFIGENNVLASLHGLHNVTHVGQYLMVTENNLITNLDPLANIESVGNALHVTRNQSLTNIDGLSGITTIVGGLVIAENPLLVDIDSLSGLTSIGDGILIRANNLLENLNGLSGVTTFAGDVSIYENPQLNTISGLENIDYTTIYNVKIENNPLVSVCNLENLCSYFADFSNPRTVSGNATGCEDMNAIYTACNIAPPSCPLDPIEFYSQEDVDNFVALYPNCTAFPFGLYIEGNDITDLSPLNNIESINGSLFIVETGLEHLNDLDGLTSINGEIVITNNLSLTTIAGLQNIAPESIIDDWQGLVIADNPQLSLCSLNNLCTYLSDYDNQRTISGNATGCGESELNALCGIVCPPPGDISFSSQDDLDAFGAMFPNCTQIDGNLEIYGDEITDLSPLSNIQTVQGGLSIYDTSLTHVNGLSNLTAVNGAWFVVSGNSLLEDISGFSNVNLNNLNPIDMEYDGLYVGYNPLLSVCNIPNFCDYLSNDPATHPRIIELNAAGCATTEDIATACLEPFPCLTPVSVTALATFDNATISWQSMGTSFDIEWGLSEFTQGEGLGFQSNISELNYTITGLSGETSYDVYVRRNCLDTSSASNWVKYTFSTVSVCPSGDLFLSSQEDIDAFGAMYPNCTQIEGNLQIGAFESENGIADLSPLSNIQIIQGGLIISATSLTHLNGLSNLTAVNGEMVGIGVNSLLEDISGLSNVSLNPIAMQSNGLFIVSNSLLSVCNIPNFCEYLSNPDNPRIISGNNGDCETSDDIVNKCFAGNCASYTIWNGASWSNGTPDNTKRVIVRNDLTVSSDMIACELLLESGIVNVNTGTTFTVEGEIHNTKSADNFIVENDANLIQLNDVENIGAITVKRNSFPLYRQDYTLWSSPVAGQNLRNFSPATLFNRFTSYDPSLGSNGEYVQEIVTTADMNTKTFIDAKGYMIRMPNNWPVFVNEATPGTPFPGVFKGIPNNGTVSIPLSFANSGLNLVGNPYPSSISIEGLFDANPDIQRVLYFWRKRNDMSGSGYATYTALGLTSVQNEINGLDLQNTIKPGQGFFVKSNGVTSLNFDNQMRTSGQNGHFLRNGNTIEKHRFWLNLSLNNQVLGQTLIGYVSGATSGVDNGIDAAYFNDSALALTSLIDDAEYIIQGRSLPFAASDVVPLGFKSDVAGNFTISLSNFDGLFADDQAIYLKDNATGALHNLKSANYSFTAPTGVFNDRFEVQYNTTLGTNNPVAHNAILIGVQNQKIRINAGTIVMDRVELIDVMGRVIYMQGGVNATSVLLENIVSSNQVLLVRITTKEHGIVTQKIIF